MGAFSEVFSNEQISQMMNEFRSSGPKPSSSVAAEDIDPDESPMPATGPQLPMFITADQLLAPTVGPDYMRTPNWLNRQSVPTYPDTFAAMPTYATPGYSEGRIAASIPIGPGTLGFGASGNMSSGKPAFTGADIQYSQGDNSYGLEYRTDPKGQAILGRFSTRF